jgi:uncharacterized protein YkwD
MLCFHAYARRRAGVGALRTVPELERSARSKAELISACHQFSHRPCGRPIVSVFSDAGYLHGTWSVGENLAVGSGPLGSVSGTFARWLDSPGHRHDLLNPAWHDIGVARRGPLRVSGYADVILWVVHFGTH